jgi:hypothetical protein
MRRNRILIALSVLSAVTVALGQWDAERRLTSNTSLIDMPSAGNAHCVAMTSNAIHVVYHEYDGFLDSRVFYTRSTDNGANWTSRVQLSGGSMYYYGMFPAIAVDGTTVHAVWLELNAGMTAFDIKYRRSTNAGGTWLSTQTVSSGGTTNEVPAIAVSGNNVHVVWDDGGSALYYRRSTDGGVSWLSQTTISSSAATGSVAVDGNNVLVSYSVGSGSAWDIYLRRSTDGGANFASAQAIETASNNADISSVAVRGSNGSIVWYDNGSGNYDVRFRRSTDAGATWQSPVTIAGGSSSQEDPCIFATPSNILHVTYEDNAAGNYENIYKRSTDNGVTWGDSFRLTNAVNISQRPTLAVVGNDTVGVVYGDGRYSENYPDVFFRRGIVASALPTHDVGCTHIVAPAGVIDSGTIVTTPACSVYNFGTTAETYTVRMRIGTGYNQTAQVAAHPPSTRVYVTFPVSWTAMPRGYVAMRCSTELANDTARSNDCKVDSVMVRVLDAQALSIDVPPDTVDSGTVLSPQATVRNDGVPAASFPVWFEITGLYLSTGAVTNLAPGATQAVTFDPYTLNTRGSWPVRCTTRLTGDVYASNNLRTGTVFIRVRDAHALAILAPTDTVDSGASIVPRAVVRNDGNTPATCSLRFTITDGYSDTRTVTNLAPDSAETLSFASWTATQLGAFTTRCTTMLAGDLVPANNVVTGSVFTRLRDVEAVSIEAPTDTVDSGVQVQPSVTLRNNGNSPVTFDVRFTVSDGYSNTGTVSNLGPGATTSVVFAPWTAARRGTFATKCTTMLAGDVQSANDSVAGSVTVAVHDVAATAITAPSGAAPPGPLTPEATVRNCGTVREPCKVFFAINSAPAYLDSLQLPSGLPLADTILGFASWTATPGNYVARCSVYMASDQVRVNDTVSAAFTVRNVDVGAVSIVVPTDTIDSGALVRPAAIVGNYGATAATFKAFFLIDAVAGNVYRDTLTVANLGPGDTVRATFCEWPKPRAPGQYWTRCSTYIVSDQNPANDTVGGWFVVAVSAPPLPPGWHEKHPLPGLPSGKQVKDGGWLALNAGNGLVYAAKGNKTADFYSYDPTEDSWTRLAPMPDGKENRRPGKGAVGYADGRGVVYATKGNNTQGFFKYVAGKDSWYQLADIPLGTTNKKVKGGTDIVFIPGDPGYVYLLKGYKNEFWRYKPASDSWSSLPDAPAAKWDKGSWLVYDDAKTVFAHQAKYHGFYAYDIQAGSWGPALGGMPYIGMMGKSKKSKDGGCGAWLRGAIYALKGGNTQEFWRYNPALDSWHELDTMPQFGTTGKKKKVKAGGDITATADLLYALKGNKTLEFWQYVPYTTISGQQTSCRNGVQDRWVIGKRRLEMTIVPNPMRAGFATVCWAGGDSPHAGTAPCRVGIYDATGRTVLHQTYGVGRDASSVRLDLRSMNAGVYIVRLSGADFAATQKLIVQR